MSWKKFWGIAPYVALYTASVLIVGLINVLSIEGNVAFWRDAAFWSRTVSQNVASALVLTATIMLYLEKRMEEDDEYIELSRTVRTAVLNDIRDDFGEFHFQTNKDTKIKTYQAMIQAEIAKAEKKADPEDLMVWYDGTDEDKEQNDYCQERIKLERTIETKWLEKRILAMKVDYDYIDRSFVETGELKRSPKEYEKQDSLGRKIKDNLPRFFLGVAFAAFVNGFLYGTNAMDATFWWRFAYGFGILIWMYISGKAYAIAYVRKILIVDLKTRFNVIKKYFTWQLAKKKKEVKNGDSR